MKKTTTAVVVDFLPQRHGGDRFAAAEGLWITNAESNPMVTRGEKDHFPRQPDEGGGGKAILAGLKGIWFSVVTADPGKTA